MITLRPFRLVVVIALITCVLTSLFAQPAQKSAECGAKCLYVILRANGKGPETYRKLIEELGRPPKNGYSLLQLEEPARERGLFVASMKVNKEALINICKFNSVIIHLNNWENSKSGHYMICRRVSSSGVTIFDGDGSAAEVSDELFSHWTGNALVVSRYPIELKEWNAPGQWSTNVYSIPLTAVLAVIGIVIITTIRKSRKRVVGAWWLVVLMFLGGCSGPRLPYQPKVNSNSANNEATQSRKSGPPGETGIWFKERVINVGNLRRGKGQEVLAVKIYNSDSEQVVIKESNYSCSCLTCRFFNPTIAAKSDVSCDLMLDTTTLGFKSSIATISTDRNQHASIAVSWNVIADLISDPELINNIELKSGDSKTVSVKLVQENGNDFSKLRAQSVIYTKGADKNVVVVAELKGDRCSVTFSVAAGSPSGLVSGQVNIEVPGNDATTLGIPFTIYVACDIELAPTKLFLNVRDSQYYGQLQLNSQMVSNLDPMKVTWKGKLQKACDYKFFDQEGARIITVFIKPGDIVGISSIEISAAAGGFIKEIPVFIP